MADFKINEFGEIVRDGVDVSKTDDKANQDLYAEYTQLEYEIFSHPERWTAQELATKKERFNFIKQKLNIKETNPFIAARKKLQEKQSPNKDVDVLKQRIAALKKQND